jgi:hypothetical protein
MQYSYILNLFSSALFISSNFPFICGRSFFLSFFLFLSFRATFFFANADYRLIRMTPPPPVLRISEGFL